MTRRMGSKLVLSVLGQPLSGYAKPAWWASYLEPMYLTVDYRSYGRDLCVCSPRTGVGYRIAVSFRSTPTGLQGRKLGHAHRHFRLQAFIVDHKLELFNSCHLQRDILAWLVRCGLVK